MLKSQLGEGVLVRSDEGYIHLTIDLSKSSINQVLQYILANHQIEDLKISEDTLESIVKKIYENKQA